MTALLKIIWFFVLKLFARKPRPVTDDVVSDQHERRVLLQDQIDEVENDIEDVKEKLWDTAEAIGYSANPKMEFAARRAHNKLLRKLRAASKRRRILEKRKANT